MTHAPEPISDIYLNSATNDGYDQQSNSSTNEIHIDETVENQCRIDNNIQNIEILPEINSLHQMKRISPFTNHVHDESMSSTISENSTNVKPELFSIRASIQKGKDNNFYKI